MSIIRQQNWLGQQRIDVPHLRALESSIAADFDILAGQMLAGQQPLVIKGLNLVTSGAIGNPATSLVLDVAGALILHPTASEPGTIFAVLDSHPAELLNSTNSIVDGNFTPNTTNYIGLDLRREADDETADLVAFLDANTLTESTKTVPLARTLKYRIIISTNDFSILQNVLPIAKVITNSNNNVTAIEDARNMLFRLGQGGSVPNSTSSFAWGSRLENTSGNVFAGGDKELGSFKDFADAVMTRLWELGGGEYWYRPNSDREVKLLFGQPTLPSNSDNFAWTLGTELLEWSGLAISFANSTAVYNTITSGSATLTDGQCLYVDVDRATNGATIVAMVGDLATLGSPTIPGSRHVIAWRNGGDVFVKDKAFEIGRTIPVASTTVLGTVKLAYAAGTPTAPVVAPLDANGTITATATGGNANGMVGTGNGTGTGLYGTGGSSDGVGVWGWGGGSSGIGIRGNGSASGPGAYFDAGDNAPTVLVLPSGYSGSYSASADPSSLVVAAKGTVPNLSDSNTNQRHGIVALGNAAGAGVRAVGGATGAGVVGIGGSTSGAGVTGTASAGNSVGVQGTGNGTGAGVRGIGSAGAGSAGVRGESSSATGYGGFFSNASGTALYVSGTATVTGPLVVDDGLIKIWNGSDSSSIGIGDGTLSSNTTGTFNVAVGQFNLALNTIGSYNVALGHQSLQSNTDGNYNTASGFQSLYSNTTGYENTASGSRALYLNTTGYNNTATGTLALNSNVTGNNNTATGWNVLRFNTGNNNTGTGARALGSNLAGANNTASGYWALYGNTSGNNNTASGSESLRTNSTGSNNTASGYQALYSATTADNNTAVGSEALALNTTGSNNVANGYQALGLNTTGNGNVASGFQAVYSNTTGLRNTGIGSQSLYSNTEGIDNTASGSTALRSNTTGNYNTASGSNALRSNTTASNNTASGYQTLYYNSTGADNTATGFEALKGGAINTTGSNNTASGSGALRSNISGNDNTAIGKSALTNTTTASSNTALGSLALSGISSAENFSNCTGLGYNSDVSGSNQVQLGDSATTTYAYGAVQNRSDARDKADIKDTDLGLEFLQKLRPVDFRWDYRDDYVELVEEEATETDEDGAERVVKKIKKVQHAKDGSKKRARFHHGFIAQEVKVAMEELGIDFGGYQDHSVKGGKDVLSIGYEELIAPLVRAVQELAQQNDELKKRLAVLEDNLDK